MEQTTTWNEAKSDNQVPWTKLRRSLRIQEKREAVVSEIRMKAVTQNYHKFRGQTLNPPIKAKSTSTESNSEEETPVKRGRGRPRGQTANPTNKAKPTESISNEAPIKRGRGRPRGQITNPKVEPTESKFEETPVKRGRGRPRGSTKRITNNVNPAEPQINGYDNHTRTISAPLHRTSRDMTELPILAAAAASLHKPSARKLGHPIKFRHSRILNFLNDAPIWFPFCFCKGRKATRKTSLQGNEEIFLSRRECIVGARRPEIPMMMEMGTQTIATLTTSSMQTEAETPEEELSSETQIPEADPPKPRMMDVGTDTCNILDPNQTAAVELMDHALAQIKSFNEGNPDTKYWSIYVVVNEAPEPAADCSVEALGEPADL